ncbi:hypothetical protein GH714_030629 [Hevea brasiliensis]|uniref:Uncharacterized protein n=1 Tax=Hevea brasiliensis TaxID=3981 RepID=A0A6A6LHK9_HEVBR|nr:hypothetical protein GH714_030629 [Hevea brasiliensis]
MRVGSSFLYTDEKMKLLRKEHRGYSPLYAENVDPSACSKGDSKESFYIGPLERSDLNQWPSEDMKKWLNGYKFSPGIRFALPQVDVAPSDANRARTLFEKLYCDEYPVQNRLKLGKFRL